MGEFDYQFWKNILPYSPANKPMDKGTTEF